MRAVVVAVSAAVAGAAALVGVVVGWPCWAGEVVDAAADDSDDGEAFVGVVDAGDVVGEAVPDVVADGVSDVVGVVSDGAAGVLVGPAAGTRAADDGGTV